MDKAAVWQLNFIFRESALGESTPTFPYIFAFQEFIYFNYETAI